MHVRTADLSCGCVIVLFIPELLQLFLLLLGLQPAVCPALFLAISAFSASVACEWQEAVTQRLAGYEGVEGPTFNP